MQPKRVRNVDSIRMHKAVSARMANPNLSLFDALCIGGFEYTVDDDSSCLRDDIEVTLGQRKAQLARCLRLAGRIIQRESAIPPVLPIHNNGYKNINVTTHLPSMNVDIHCNMRFKANQQCNINAHQAKFLHQGIKRLGEVPSSGADYIGSCPSSQPFNRQSPDMMSSSREIPPAMAFSSQQEAPPRRVSNGMAPQHNRSSHQAAAPPRRLSMGMMPQHKLLPPMEMRSGRATYPFKFDPEAHGSESMANSMRRRQEQLALVGIGIDILSYHGDDHRPQDHDDHDNSDPVFDQIDFLPISSDHTVRFDEFSQDGKCINNPPCEDEDDDIDDGDSLFGSYTPAFDDFPPSSVLSSPEHQAPDQNRRTSLMSDGRGMRLPPPSTARATLDPVEVFPGSSLRFFPTKKDAKEEEEEKRRRQRQRAISPDQQCSCSADNSLQ